MHETVREQTVGCPVSECAVISQLTGTISKLCFNRAESQDINGGGMGLGHSKPVASKLPWDQHPISASFMNLLFPSPRTLGAYLRFLACIMSLCRSTVNERPGTSPSAGTDIVSLNKIHDSSSTNNRLRKLFCFFH